MGDGHGRKGYFGGTHRLISPEKTLERVKPFMPVMGITRIANVTGLDTIGIPVVMVSRPNSRSISVSQGKGADLPSAKASGLMESVESYHAERISLPLKLGSFEDLRYSHHLIDVEGLPRLTDSRFTPYAQLLWIEGNNLFTETSTWVPFELVHLNYTLPLPTGYGCFVANSNGLASGNHLLEATSHAICEVIERDATTLWHCLDDEAQRRTRVDLETVNDPRCRMLLEKYRAAGVIVGIWETTSDIGIPAFICRTLQSEGPPRSTIRPATGMGCHQVREVALLRALTEAAQSRLTFISGARDDLPRREYEHFLDPQTYDIWHAHLAETDCVRDFRDIATWRSDSFEEDISLLLARLGNVGIDQVVTVDLTKPEFGIPVVRVVIPGLEGLDHSPKHLPGPRARAVREQ